MIINRQSIKDFIEGGKQYIIPQYQRHYSWDKKKWEKLFDDVYELFAPTDAARQKPPEHFMGAIVSVPLAQSSSGVSRFQIVDGQQRLTTIMLLLCALRDRQSAEEAEITRVELIANFTKKGDDYHRVLHTDMRDRQSFMAISKAENLGDIRSKPKDVISMAYKYFWERLIIVNDLDRFKNILTSSLYVVHLQLGAENPYVIFESLNAYSEPLTQADLIRNYFFMHAPIKEHDQMYQEFWLPMEQSLPGHGEKPKPGKSKDFLTDFIRHYLMRAGELVNLRDVYFTLKDEMDKTIKGGQLDEPDHEGLLQRLADLKKFASFYGRLVVPEREPNLEIQKRLATLNYIQQTTAYPLLLNVYEAYEAGQVTPAQFQQILDLLLNFLVRRSVCEIGTYGLNKMFCKLALESKQHQFDIGHLQQFLASHKYPTDARFAQALQQRNIYTSGSDRLARVILTAIEESYEHAEAVDLSQSNIEIEHVLPQTLSPWWEQHLGEDFNSIKTDYCHVLGNLTLTGVNQALGNGSFPDKKKKLADSHIELNRYFQAIPNWHREEIVQRGLSLSSICLEKIWPHLNPQSATINEHVGRRRGARPTAVVVWNQRIEAKTWSTLVPALVEQLLELAPEKFDILLDRFPRHIRRERGKWRQAAPIANEKAWIITSWPAESAIEFCEELSELFELDEWNIEFADEDVNSPGENEATPETLAV